MHLGFGLDCLFVRDNSVDFSDVFNQLNEDVK